MKAWQAVAAVATISMALALQAIPQESWVSTGALSLASGVAALSLMACSALLGGRWSVIETAIGGLDRVYDVHKWLAVWALVLASVHLLFKAGDPLWEMQKIVSLPPFWTRFVRQASFIGLMAIIILAINRNIRYNVWRWWHRLSGPLFLIVVAHWLSIRSPFGIDSPAGYWLAALSVLAVVAAAYKLLLYPLLASHAEYEIVGVERAPDAALIELQPMRNGLNFQAGQFGFLRIKADGLREPHPFTIAGAPGVSGRITFVIRALGDYTSKLVSEVEPGMYADVYGPYGRFQRKSECSREIWIGGGVGISPFIAWMRDEAPGGFEKVTLFYFYTPPRDFPNAAVLADMASNVGLEFIPVTTGPNSPDFIKRFDEIMGSADHASLDIAACGPQGLLDAVRREATKHGLPRHAVRYELFRFR